MATAIRRLERPGDLGWVIQANAETYAGEFGWNTDFEILVARIVADYAASRDPRREDGWIAELDGRRAGCVLCVADPEEPAAAKLRVLLVDPSARGHGLGGQLVDTCVNFARDAGYERMRLWTVDGLDSARRIYLSRGFELRAEWADPAFGKPLTSQTYELALKT